MNNYQMVDHILDALHNLAVTQTMVDGFNLPDTMLAISYIRDIENQLEMYEAEYADCSLGLHNLQ